MQLVPHQHGSGLEHNSALLYRCGQCLLKTAATKEVAGGEAEVVTHAGLCLQELIDYRAKYLGPTPPPIMALGLSSRKNLCIHPSVAGACLSCAAEPRMQGL